MAYANQSHRASAELTLGGWFSALRADLAQRWTRHQLYKTTLAELSQLTDRDLADLGLHRESIRDIAKDAARAA